MNLRGDRLGLLLAGLLVVLVACSNTDPANDTTAHIPRDIYQVKPSDQCPARVWITGTITPGARIRDDSGVVYGLMWGAMNTAHVEYGKRYKIGGDWFSGPKPTLWACAGAEAVIPQ